MTDTLSLEQKPAAKIPPASVLQSQLPPVVDRRRHFASRQPVFQSFEFPLAAFVGAKLALDLADLTTVRFIFDRTPSGVVILGIRN